MIAEIATRIGADCAALAIVAAWLWKGALPLWREANSQLKNLNSHMQGFADRASRMEARQESILGLLWRMNGTSRERCACAPSEIPPIP